MALLVLGCAYGLCVVAWAGDTPTTASAPPSPAAEEPNGERSLLAAEWESTDVAAPRLDPPLARRPERASNRGTHGSGTTSAGQPWWRTTLALGGVVGLIMLLAWGYRVAVGPGGKLTHMLRGGGGGLIEIVSRTTLSPKQSLCLVRIGPRLILLGVTPDAVRSVDVISDPVLAAQLLGEAAKRRPDSHMAQFERCLASEAEGYSAKTRATSEIDETVTPDEPRLVELKQKLAGTINRLRGAARTT